MIVIVDFCKTLVPFNTTFEFFNIICSKNILFKFFWYFSRILSRFGVFIEEKNQLKIYKAIAPKTYNESLKEIASKIDGEFNMEVFNKIEDFISDGAFVVINTATFEDFFRYSEKVNFSNIIIASTLHSDNKGEMKLKNLVNLDLLNYKKKVVFSDSFAEDFALFLIADEKYYVHNGKASRI